MERITDILIKRDGLTLIDATRLVDEASLQLDSYLLEGRFDLAEDICSEYFGLEPDYFIQLI